MSKRLRLKNLFLIVILFFGLILFSSCKLLYVILETPTNLKLEDSILTWDEDEDVHKYYVYIDEVEESPFIVSTPSIDLSNLELEDDTIYTIRVQAVGLNNKYINSDLSEEITFEKKKLIKLDTPTAFIIEGTNLIWEEVEGANSYIIKNGNSIVKVKGYYYDLTNFNNFEAGKSYEIAIIASGDPDVYIESDAYTLQYTFLSKPVLKLNENILSWNPIENSNYYQIKVGEKLAHVTATTIDIDFHFPHIKVGEDTEVTVTPINVFDNYNYSLSSESIIYNKLPPRLDTPKVKLEGNIIRWDEDYLASKYIVKIGSYEEEVEDVFLDLETIVNLEGGKEINVNVIAIPEDDVNFRPSLSGSIKYTVPYKKLDTPVLRINHSVISWDPISDATGYIIYLDNYQIVIDKTSFDLSKEDVEYGKIYDVHIRAITDLETWSPSNISNIVRFVREFDNLEKPTNINKTDSRFIWNEVDNANGYLVKIEGDETTYYEVNENYLELADENFTRGIEYKVFVKAIGNGKTHMSSEFSLPFVYKRELLPQLNTPTGELIEKILSWDEVDNAIKYKVIIGDKTVETNELSINLDEIEDLQPGTLYDVFVIAVGDNEDYMNSLPNEGFAYTTPKQKLLTPNNLFITETVISFDKVVGADSYKIYIDDEHIDTINTNSFDITKYSLDSGNYSIRVIAIGDESKFINSDLSDELEISVHEKLSTPIVTAQQTQLIWNSVENAVKYKLFVDDLVFETTETRYIIRDIFGLSPNTAYNAKVVAIGDLENYSFSNPSEEVEFISFEYVSVTNDVQNYNVIHETLYYKDELVINIEEQFKNSGIDIYDYELLSTNEDVAYFDGKKLITKNSGITNIIVSIYERSTSTYHIATSAIIYVINENTMIEIKSADDLININNNLYGNYILMNDIDLSKIETWIPIGANSPNKTFNGMFVNPYGYVIKNLTIPSLNDLRANGYNDPYAGLFAATQNAYIDGIILENVFIDLSNDEDGYSYSAVGSITAAMLGGMVKNVKVSGTIIAQNYAGGIIGSNSWGSIIDCSFEGIIKTVNNTGNTYGTIASGGIVGHSAYFAKEDLISDCKVLGIITSDMYAGGIVGIVNYKAEPINSTFEGIVKGQTSDGEIVGEYR